ncbi:MAG: arginase family protein [Polyangiaceae bacterium]
MRQYSILEAPSVLGLWPSGVERLPEALLAEGLRERLGAEHAGRVEPPPFDATRDQRSGLLNPRAIADYSSTLADTIAGLLERDRFPVVLGGDCSILLGGLLALRRRLRPGLLFLDGQADFYQPEAEPKGEAASMDLALATGRGPAIVTDIEGRRPLVRDEDVVVLGFRDAEDAAEHGSQPLAPDIRALTLGDVRRLGAAAAARTALAHLTRNDGPDRFWIHVDADVLSDAIMPAVDYRMPDGLGWDELRTVLWAAATHPRAAGLELCIYNPALDPTRAGARGLAGVLVSALTERG